MSSIGGAILTIIDGASSTADWEPQINGPATADGNSYGFEFEIRFTDNATGLPYMLSSLVAQAIDIDGGGAGSWLREFNTFMAPNSYTVETPTNLTVTNIGGGYKFQSGEALYVGISILATEYIASCTYSSVSSLTVFCGVDAVGGSCSANRLFSFNFRNVVVFDTPAQALPIQLVVFEAEKLNYGKVMLTWETLSESNNDYFTVEKLDDFKQVTEVSSIKGSSNSDQSIVYNCYDYQAENKVLYYRLRQTDFDGNFTYSSIISIDNTFEKPEVVSRINLMGQQASADEKGVVILVYEDNSTAKTIE